MADDYVEVTDAQLTYKKGFGQDLARQLGGNLRNHEARIQQLLAQSHQAIIDDFFGENSAGGTASGVDETLYDVTGSGPTFKTMMGASGAHVLQAAGTNIGTSKRIMTKPERLRLRLNQDMAIEFRARVQDIGAAAPPNILLGFSDNDVETDESDCIAFFKGTTAGKWRFRCAKGGVDSSSDNIGNRASWDWLTITIERSGGGSTFQVRAYVGGTKTAYGSEIPNSPFTTNLPDTVVLGMVSGLTLPNPGAGDHRLDRWSVRWTDIPENS